MTYKDTIYAVTNIGHFAFAYSDSLTEIVIPDSITSIGMGAFSGCIGLTEIVIPDSVTSMGKNVVDSCSGLVIRCEGTTSRGWNEYWNVHTTDTEIAYGQYWYTYHYCPVVWDCNNNDVAADGYIYEDIDGVRYALKGGAATVVKQPNNIAETYIPETVTYKGTTYAVTSISKKAFYNCSNLTKIVIPDSVKSVGLYAFAYCDNLTIYCEAESKPNGWNNSWNISSRPVVWGYEIEGEEDTDDKENSSDSNTSESEEKGTEGLVYYKIDDTSVAVIGYEGTETEIVIASTYEGLPVVEVANGAFAYLEKLTKIVIPNSVKRIGGSAFVDCDGLTEIIIPDSVTSIGSLAFQYCDNLTKIVIPKSMTSISESAFSWCTGLKEVVLHDDVTEIAAGAFSYCENLTEIVIPDSVTSIGSQAFIECSALKKIVIPASVTSIGDYAFAACNQLTVSCKAMMKPSSWSDIWNKLDMISDSYCPVVWGYTDE